MFSFCQRLNAVKALHFLERRTIPRATPPDDLGITMSNSPAVSVIIPTWNRREALASAVRSALAQKDVPVEVLVCDDGSDDGTREMIEAWGDDRVHLITGPRAGRPAVPRNRGIAVARGEWLAFLDDDDEWLPHKLSRQLAAARSRNCFAACSDAIRRLPDESDLGRYLGAGVLPACLTLPKLFSVNMVICSSALIHRSLLQDITGFPENEDLRAVEDYALWLKVASITDFAAVDEPLLIYLDAAQVSIRRFSHPWRQRRNVLLNYLRWCAVHPAARRFVPLVLANASRHLLTHPVTSPFRRLVRWLKKTLRGKGAS